MLSDNPSQQAKQNLSMAEQESERLKRLYLGIERIFIALTRVDKQ